jgi:hypothetical protein
LLRIVVGSPHIDPEQFLAFQSGIDPRGILMEFGSDIQIFSSEFIHREIVKWFHDEFTSCFAS